MKRVIAIVGEKRVGKDTVADYLCESLGCKKHALATPLKELVCNLFDISMVELDYLKNEEWNLQASTVSAEDELAHTLNFMEVSFRSILQRCGDSQKEFFGLDCYMRKLHDKLLHEDMIVVSDVRLVEEQIWLMNNTNVTFVKIVRNVKQDKDSTHRTELEVCKLGYDHSIENNGTFEELYAKVDEFRKTVFNPKPL